MSTFEAVVGEDPRVLETAGVRRNRALVIPLTLTGEEIYQLLDVLERRAAESTDYLAIRNSVLLAELVRRRAMEQGF